MKDFPGTADSVVLLRFECIINPQNLMKIVEAVFQKTKIFINRKKNRRQEIFARGLQKSNLNKIGQLV